MMERLEEIRERLNKTTPGPWEWQEDILCRDEPFALVLKPFYDDDTGKISTCIFPNDRDFIANSPADISYLLELITAMQERNAILAEAFENMQEIINREAEKNAVLEEDNAALTKALKLKDKALEMACERIEKLETENGNEYLAFEIEKHFIQQALSAINSKEGEK